AYLRSLGTFRDDFIDFLSGLTFEGDVFAIPEGEAVFPQEPLLRITAPLIQAQLVETYLLNIVNYSTMIASKAARVSIACDGRPYVDFSARRTHGPDTSILAARAAYIAGASATSNVMAGKAFGIPVSGTMAHSYVMTFPDERSAFFAFARAFPANAIFLIDTFDTLQGARAAAGVAEELREEGISVRAVRLDSGDLATLAREVRALLDDLGHPEIQIFASGDLDEYRVADLLSRDSPIDGFGVGTRLGTSSDAPFLGAIYKLVEDKAGPKRKLSTGKMTLPGLKQVYRLISDGKFERDVLALQEESPVEGGQPVLLRAMEKGRRIVPHVDNASSTQSARERFTRTLANIPEPLRSLGRSASYEVSLSPALAALVPHWNSG
ncbi:MAG: nicotinate phosphoribosyltransferase, partial [Acidimicrobiia bacterium]